MGRYLLCGKEAELPFEIEELDLRIYTIEELCYYIYNNLMLIGDDFIGDRLIDFIRNGLSMPEIADKITAGVCTFFGVPVPGRRFSVCLGTYDTEEAASAAAASVRIIEEV